LNCPQPQSNGYGKITQKSKEQQQEAAEARNQYEHEQDQLAYEGQNNECQSQQFESSGQGCLTEIIDLNGEYEAQEDLTETQHAKSAEAGKGATCFRREAFQHLNQIGKACDYDVDQNQGQSCTWSAPAQQDIQTDDDDNKGAIIESSLPSCFQSNKCF
jgi:type II secretory pathway pseudopilin PulG